jgi:hypothetical protein
MGSGGGDIGTAGRGGTGGGRGGSDTSSNCASLDQTVTLNSPNASVIKTLTAGDRLNIELQGSSVVALTQSGAIAGSITFAGIASLKRCLQKGHAYIATVIQVIKGNCEVRIRPQ